MQLLSSESILLRRREFQDSHWIITFLTADRGLIKGVVRGARKLTSRGVGNFEPLSSGVIYYHINPNRELVQIRKRDNAAQSWWQSQSYEKFCYGSYLAELMELGPIAAEQSTACYQLLSEGLKEVFQASRLRLLPLIRLRFELKYLRLMGIQPSWDVCVSCGKVPPWSGIGGLSFSRGGILCPLCVRQNSPAPPISSSSLAFISAWQGGGRPLKPQQIWLEQLLAALSAYLCYQVGRQPRSLKLLPNLDELASGEQPAT